MGEERTDRPLAPANPTHLSKLLLAKPARKNSSVACSECREKKTKCVGGVPCTKCRERQTECIIDEASDKRRRIDLKRKIQSLESDRDLLHQLVDTLRTDSDCNSSDVLNLIRSNASLDEIRLSVAESLNPRNSERADGLGRNTRRKYLDINRLSDIPRWSVPARPWTTVTDDDDLVSHLISLYFTWNHQVLNWTDRDLFIRDMQSGKIGAQFCSPLLVNAILALACFYSEYPEVLATPGDSSSRGVHFYNEAKQLLEKEEGRLRLTTLQAMGDIYTMTCVMGKDRLGWKVLVDIADSVRGEYRSGRSQLISDAGEQGEEMRLALDKAILGLFNLAPTATLALQKPSVMRKPDIRRLPEDHDPADTWVPYPLQEEPRPSHTNCVANALHNLQVVTWEISDYFFGDNEFENVGMPPYSELERIIGEFYTRLQDWTKNTSECVSLGHTPTPGAIEMHMRYHMTIMTIFGYLKGHPETADSSFESIRQAQAIRIDAARRTSELSTILRTRWPMVCMPGNCMQYTTIALFTLFEDLDNKENSDAFVNVCIALRGLARRWNLAKGMLRLIQINARQQNINLPEETRSLFRDFEAESWKVKDHTRFSSLYPNFAATVHDQSGSLDSTELDRFLEKWDDMSLSTESSEKATPEFESERQSS